MKEGIRTKVLKIIEGILFMLMMIAIAGLDASNTALCLVLITVSALGLFIANKVEENYVLD